MLKIVNILSTIINISMLIFSEIKIQDSFKKKNN